jgi:hypothetical protein
MSSEKKKTQDLLRAARDAAQADGGLVLSSPALSSKPLPVEPPVTAPANDGRGPLASPEIRETRESLPMPSVEREVPAADPADVGERSATERTTISDDDAPTQRMSVPDLPRRALPTPERPARRRPFTSLPETSDDWRDRYKVRVRPTVKRAPVVHRPQSVQVCQELADDFGRLLELLDPDTKPHQRRATSNSAILRLAIGELSTRYRRRTSQELLARIRSKAVRGRETTVRINYALEAEQWSKLQTWLLELNAMPPLKPVIGLAHLAEVALEELIPRLIGSASEPELFDRLKASAVRGEGD